MDDSISEQSDLSEYSDQSIDDVICPEHWDVSSDEFEIDCEAASEHQTVQQSSSKDVIRISLILLMLWSSFYGISATALNHLIKLVQHILTCIVPNLLTSIKVFPKSLYMTKKYLGFSNDIFDKYIICKKCGSLYTLNECLNTTGTGFSQKQCYHIAYRNHPRPSCRNPCGCDLMKEVALKDKIKYCPVKTYCYLPLKTSLLNILQRKGYLSLCEQWRTRDIPDGVLADIYDGEIWKKFMTYDDRQFLSQSYNLAVMLNCDYFQPFDHSCYSVGVLYMVILNLPRSIRFKPENIIITGIIPGPKEPKQNEMNSYLRPLIKELNSLWTDGFLIKYDSNEVKIFVALIATVCDIPAAGKIGGHNSHLGCWKCTKFFPYSEALRRVDYTGIEIGSLRTHENHKKNAKSTLSAKTPTERKKQELEVGSKFTEFFHLPYYDCVRYAIIDPLHNLFLGTAKRLQHHWIEIGLLSSDKLSIIQQRVDSFKVPSHVGHLPRKISSGFSNMTADEWKNWTILYSLVALHDIIPNEHLACWEHFVSACTLLCSSTISLNEIDQAQQLLKEFLCSAEALYGPKFFTINTHLHLHYSNVYKDYGPCYGYWLFSFERYNGILGKYHTNQKSIEIQLMRTFINDMHVRSIAQTDIDAVPEVHRCFFENFLNTKVVNTFTETLFGQQISSFKHMQHAMSVTEEAVCPSMIYLDQHYVKFLPPYTVHKLDSDSLRYLRESYQAFLPEVDPLEIPQLCCRYQIIQWWFEHLGKRKYCKKNPETIRAYWVGQDGKIASEPNSLCAGRAEYFFTQKVLIKDSYKEVAMVKMRWYQEHPDKEKLSKPIEIWCNQLSKPFGPASFMPITRIHSICVTCEIELNNEKVLAINPTRKKVFY